MRLKHLESALSSVPVKEFPDPKVQLEQYATSPHLTAAVILTALSNEDIGPGRTAMDLGCGTGMLTIGCALVDTDHVTAVDCDCDAMAVARSNVSEMLEDDDDDDDNDNVEGATSPPIDFVFGRVQHAPSGELTDVSGDSRKGGRRKGGKERGRDGRGGRRGARGESGRSPSTNISESGERSCRSKPAHSMRDNLEEKVLDGLPFRSNCVDTILTNPPFGTKQNAGIDVAFLRAATRMACRAVYSFHKSSTRAHLLKRIKEWGYDVEVVAQMKYDIPKTYKFHRENSVDVEVDLIRVILQ